MERAAGKRKALTLAITAGLAAAFGAGLYAAGNHRAEFAFLQRADLVAVQRDPQHGVTSTQARTTTYYYTIQEDWNRIFERAKQQIPGAMESRTRSLDPSARELIVPTHDGDRVSVLFPPERILLVKSGRIAIDSHGKLAVEKGSDRDWSTVEVLDFRQPSPLDALADWIRHAVPS